MTRSHPRIPPKISTSITTFEVLTQPVSPPRQYPIAKYSLVSSDCRVDLWMNGFGGFNEFVFCIVMCQVRECYASPEIHLVDVEMLSFDLGPAKLLSGKSLTRPIVILFSTRFPSDLRTVRKNKTQVSPCRRFSFFSQPR